VLSDERKTVVRLALEAPAVVSGSGRRTALRARVRLTPVRGYDEELAQVREKLARDLGYAASDQSLVDEAVIAAGGCPAGTSNKIEVGLAFDERADAAAASVLQALLGIMDANIEGTIADIDTEFLHDYRVAVRRARSVQRELHSVFPPTELAWFRAEFRWLQQVTSESRDLDVYVLDFDDFRALVPEQMGGDLEPLLAVLGDRRKAAHAAMERGLRSDHASTLRATWASFLETLVSMSEHDRPGACRPIGELAGERIRKVYKRMVAMGDAINGSSPPEDYHELRKKGKELRYLLELFGAPLYPSEVVKPMIKSLKGLQDVLGRHQDREVQVATLTALRDQVATVKSGPAALMAMGVLVAVLAEDERAARSEFGEHFEVFAAKDQRHLVKETFA
jgi:CHAD domain-containing protein